MYAITRRLIKKDLQNFPDEVIESWLLPLAKEDGWPPIATTWNALLLEKPLQFWMAVVWRKQRIAFTRFNLHPRSFDAVVGIIQTNTRGLINAYSNLRNTRKRFNDIIRYLRQHQMLPKPPVILSDGFLYRIADGNHRVAAYMYLQPSIGLISQPECWVASPP